MSDVNPSTSDEFWFKVLKKLPVKTLGKCRCVCKSWHSLIISPSFMSAHLKNYTQNQANSLLLYRQALPRQLPTTRIRFPQGDEENSLESLILQYMKDVSRGPVIYEQYIFFAEGDVSLKVCHTSIFPWTAPENYLKSCFHFVGSVFGLVCVTDNARINNSSRVLVWNPLLQKCITLPESAAARNVMGGEVRMRSVLGFGYDETKNDHRVVKISYGQGKERSEMAGPFVEVYSVQEQTWRVIPADYLVNNGIDHIRKVDPSHCFFNGVIHWLTWEDQNGSILGKWLLLFDVAEEKFERMKLPEALVESTSECGVFVCQNKLFVSCCQYLVASDYVSSCCKIWVKGEYNADSSWCIILNVILSDSVHVGPIDYIGRNGEVLGFAKESNGELMAYDSLTRQIKRLGGLRQCASTKFSAYTESLVLLGHKTDNSTQSIDQDELNRSVCDGDIFMKEVIGNFSNLLWRFS